MRWFKEKETRGTNAAAVNKGRDWGEIWIIQERSILFLFRKRRQDHHHHQLHPRAGEWNGWAWVARGWLIQLVVLVFFSTRLTTIFINITCSKD
jgi:hypothetical protein